MVTDPGKGMLRGSSVTPAPGEGDQAVPNPGEGVLGKGLVTPKGGWTVPNPGEGVLGGGLATPKGGWTVLHPGEGVLGDTNSGPGQIQGRACVVALDPSRWCRIRPTFFLLKSIEKTPTFS